MPRGRQSGLRDRLYSGINPGLPPPVTHVPFGQDCPYKEAFDLVEHQVHVVVCVLAAEAVGLGAVTMQQLADVCDYSVTGVHLLERRGWIECVGKRERSTAKLWRGTKKAWRVLGLAGWKAEVA